MPQTVLITLTAAGVSTGPFDLYCVNTTTGNVINPPFEVNVPKASLIAGYYSTLVPDGCTKIRIVSKGVTCTNYVDVPIVNANITTTTSTTTIKPTTTTTTVNPADCLTYTLTYVNNVGGTASFTYIPCNTTSQTTLTLTSGFTTVCAVRGSVSLTGGFGTITVGGVCPTTTTSTSTSTTSTSSTSTTSTSSTTTTSTSTSTTSSTTTTTTASPTSTTTTCPPGSLSWIIAGNTGGQLSITRNISGLIVDQVSDGTTHSGTVTNTLTSNTYTIQANWVSGISNSIKMRICNLTTLTEYSFDSGSGPGTSFTQSITINPCEQYSVYVTSGAITPPVCPV